MSNTAKGTPERQAVNRVEYIERRAKAPEKTARQALGHRKPGATGGKISTLLDSPPRYQLLANATPSELRRAGRYEYLVREMINGRMTERVFTRRIKSWAPIRGEHFLSDSRAIFSLLERRRQEGLPVFEYEPAP